MAIEYNDLTKYIEINNYLKELNNKPIGTSDYAPMILMVNEEKRIIEELLDDEFKHKYNLLTFLDYGVNNIIDTKKEDINTIYDTIIYVLRVFEDLDNKWEISGEDFIKILKNDK